MIDIDAGGEAGEGGCQQGHAALLDFDHRVGGREGAAVGQAGCRRSASQVIQVLAHDDARRRHAFGQGGQDGRQVRGRTGRLHQHDEHVAQAFDAQAGQEVPFTVDQSIGGGASVGIQFCPSVPGPLDGGFGVKGHTRFAMEDPGADLAPGFGQGRS